ncbi:MAG: polysulfide reductase NrfD [Anaeromyxobacteraceae bacterium]
MTRALPPGAVGPSDGRNVDLEVGALAGEAAGQLVRVQRAPPTSIADALPEEEREGTYHGLPLLKAPVWRWEIPAYFFVGGLAGACGVLGAAARLAGGPPARDLVRRCALVATAGAGVSAVLLIRDLGRPERFLNMLRVFRPTSPMNMGTWVLSGFGAASALSLAPHLLPLPPALAAVGEGAGVAAGVFGLPLVGYTGVLLANTAVPVWQETRRALPVLFAFSGAASAGDLFELWRPRGTGAAMARRLGLVSTAAELGAALWLFREADRVPRVSRPLRRGRSGAVFGAGLALAALSMVAGLAAPRRALARARRPGARDRLHAVAGALGLAGTLAIRFGILMAGRASAKDPRATFEQQRAGHGAEELVERGRVPRPMPAPPGVEPTGIAAGQGFRAGEAWQGDGAGAPGQRTT